MTKIYICPMHPEVKSEKPGRCPDCGMSLVEEKKKKNDSGNHAGHKTSSFLRKFWMSLVLTIPIIFFSDLPQALFGWNPPGFSGSSYLSLFLGSIVFFYGGWVFLVGAWREIRGRLPGMMTLIAIAISAAYVFSVGSVVSGGEHTLFWELATLITIMLLGHYLEMKSVQSAQGALKELSKLLPDTAEVLRSGKSENVPLSELKVGDIVFVRPGGKIPADGEVIEGSSEVNESAMTGESRPVLKKEDSGVIAGALNADGSLKVRVTKIGEHTFLAGVMKLVEEAQSSKSRLQILSDRAAFYLTVIAIFGGIATFVAWFVSGDGLSFAVERLVAVLVIACPHALGLAVPLTASISTTLAARNGFLVKQRLALESARSVDIILFDKTGTLTTGEYGVEKIIAAAGRIERDVVQLAASVDSHSEHFISRAVVNHAKRGNIPLLPVADFRRIAGRGVSGKVDGRTVFAGGEAILGEAKTGLGGDLAREVSPLATQGKTIIYVILDSEVIGAVALGDIIRRESKEALASLKEMGVKTAMVTGDSEEVAKWVADELGVDEYFSKVLPGEKADKVKLLQSKGLKVAMVGDGINDAPALTQADLGIAIGAGTNVAIESAGIILVKNDPRDIPKIMKLSRLTYSKMIQNLWWAAGYNIAAMPLAAGVLFSYGILLQPAVSAVLMSLSTVIVSVNAIFLKRTSL
jgi:Cu2+-exporting ATPase